MDSLMLNRIFNYRRNFTTNNVNGYTTNVYIKNNFNVWKRNSTLWLIPSMYSIAEGERYLVSESYNKLRFTDINQYEAKQQVCFSTIRHNRRAMPTIVEFLTPNLYDVCIYKDHTLSPFNQHNKHFYRYRMLPITPNVAIVDFKPRFLDNTQLVTGNAHVNIQTGRIIRATISGEFDMIRFRTETTQGDEDLRSLLPKQCKTYVEFKFMGNHIYNTFEAIYDCPATLPDSIEDRFDLTLMDSIRPIPLTSQEQHIYNTYNEAHKPDTTAVVDTMPRKFNFVRDVLKDAIGDNLVSSIRYSDDHTYMKMYPILNPQYISYSSTHGLAYKLKFGAEYKFNAHRYFEFYPWCGYNFKYKKFYFTLPLEFYYNPKRNGRVSVIYGNGNRISNGYITDDIQREYGDTLQLDNQINYYDDNYLTISNNVVAYDWLEITSGLTYHHRIAYKPELMRQYGKQDMYDSFAPMLTLKFTPWRHGPVLSVDYERGIKGILNSSTDYERWEFDGSWKHRMKPMRIINARVGAGFYTRKKMSDFVDYMHFRDNKLPESWADDWSGNFQLLDSRWYNESSYYARANLSYESPLLVTSWLPLVGRYIEKERFYFSTLSIDHTRPYTELGYGFTTRLFSIGIFTSFLNTDFQSFGSKFTFELFNRW